MCGRGPSAPGPLLRAGGGLGGAAVSVVGPVGVGRGPRLTPPLCLPPPFFLSDWQGYHSAEEINRLCAC